MEETARVMEETDFEPVSETAEAAGSDERSESGRPENEAELLKRIEALKEALFMERVKLALIDAGVEPKKSARMARLLDIERIYDDGGIDAEALDEEIASVFAEFPEFKARALAMPVGFRIGGGKIAKDDTQERIWSIFGNGKN